MDMNQVYLEIIDNINDGVYFVDLERKITFWNKAAERITGYSSDEIVGRYCQENLLSHIDEEGTPLCNVGCPLFASNIDGKQRKARVYVRHKDGHRIPLQVNIFPLLENEQIIGSIEVFTQDTPTKYNDQLVERLSGIAMHDPLTRLPNRRYIESFLSYRLADYKRFGRLFAIIFADIDDFRHFNNTYGHDAGDLVLKNIALSIHKAIEKDDLAGRWGGEKLHVTVSVGVTVVQIDDDTKSIVERADHLMYESKAAGKNRVTSG